MFYLRVSGAITCKDEICPCRLSSCDRFNCTEIIPSHYIWLHNNVHCVISNSSVCAPVINEVYNVDLFM